MVKDEQPNALKQGLSSHTKKETIISYIKQNMSKIAKFHITKIEYKIHLIYTLNR